MARPTSWGVERKLPLLVSVNTSTLDRDIYNVENGGPNIGNSGIPKDGGITNLYETGATITGASVIYTCRNGKIVSVSDSGIIKTGSSPTAMTVAGRTAQVTFSRLSGEGYIDMMPSTDLGYILALGYNDSGGIDVFNLNAADLSVVASKNLTSTTTYIGARFARANTVRYSLYGGAAATDPGFIAWDSAGTVNWHYYNTFRQVATGTFPNVSTYQAFWNAKGAVAAIGESLVKTDDLANVAFSALTYSSPAAGAVNGLTLGAINNLDSTATTLKLGASCRPSTVGVAFFVTISAAGAVATASAYGATGLFNSPTTEANFQQALTLISCIGCTGSWKNTVGPAFGTYARGFLSGSWGANYTTNSTATTAPRQRPEGSFYCGTMANGTVVVARSFNGYLSMLCGSAGASSPPSLLNDFGGGSNQTDIPSIATFSGATSYTQRSGGMFIPPTINAQSNSMTYLTQNGTPVVVNTTASGSPEYTFCEIKPGVVALNTVGANNSIIDANTGILYENCSAFTNTFHMDTASSTTTVSSAKAYNLYSSQVDPGLMYFYTAASSSTATYYQTYDDSLCNQKSGTAFYGTVGKVSVSFTGIYLGDLRFATSAANNLMRQNPAHLGSYVYNTNVPVAADSQFQNFVGINGLFLSAIQTKDWFGYSLYSSSGSNLLDRRYEAIFNIHGLTYAFDGDRIYLVTLTGGTVGVVQGALVSVAVGTGLRYLCVSTRTAYFLSPYDNSVFAFDGGFNLSTVGRFSQEEDIVEAVYSPRDNALVLLMSDDGTTGYLCYVWYEADSPELYDVKSNGPIATRTQLPGNPTYPAWYPSPTVYPSPTLYPAAAWSVDGFEMRSTSDAVYFTKQDDIVWRSYKAVGDILQLAWKSAYYGSDEGQCIQVGRFVFQVCFNDLAVLPISLTWDYILPDGSVGSESTTFTTYTMDAEGFVWLSWTPPHSNVLGGSVGVGATGKATLMSVLMYYVPGAEMMPDPANEAVV